MNLEASTQQLSYIANQASDARVNIELETEGMTLNLGPVSYTHLTLPTKA